MLSGSQYKKLAIMLDLYCLSGRDQLRENKGSMANKPPVINQPNFSIHLLYIVYQYLLYVCNGNFTNQRQWYPIYNMLSLLCAKSV